MNDNPFALANIQPTAPATQASNDNPFALRNIETDQRQTDRLQLQTAVAVNPDEAAEAAKLAQKYPAPPGSLLANLRDVRLQDAVDKADAQLQTSPKLAQIVREKPWLREQSHDDFPALSAISKSITEQGKKRADRTLLGTAQDVAVTALKGAVGLPQSIVGLASIPTLGYAGKFIENGGVRFDDAQKYLDTLYSPAQQQANAAVREATGFLDTLAALGANPSTIATTVGESLPQIGGGALVGRGILLAAPRVAPWLAAAFGEGVLGAGSAAESLRNEDAEDLLTARKSLAALGSGAGVALFGAAGGKLTQAVGLKDIDTALVKGGLAKTDAELLKRGFISTVTKAGISEGVFEELPQGIQEQMWQNWANEKPLGEGVGKAAAQALVVGAAAGSGFQALSNIASRDQSGIAEAEANTARLQQVFATAAASKLRERNPETFAALVQQMADETENAPTSVFIDAEVLQQAVAAIPAEELAQTLPTLAAKLAEGFPPGSLLELPIGEVMAAVPGSALEQTFLDYSRSDENAPTLLEAKEAAAQADQFLAQEYERVVAQAADSQVVIDSAERVKATILTQLNGLARFKPDVNDAYSTLVRDFYTAISSRTGQTPEQLFAKYPLRIAGGGKMDASTLAAGRLGEIAVEGYQYSSADRPVIDTAAFGTGLKGSSRDTYLNAGDKRLRKRAYFYVDKGTGINPEAGVGSRAMRANLTNVYDSNSDPLRLKEGRDQLGFESAVLDAGFSGYLDRLQGTQSGQVILLGDQRVQAETLGGMGKTTGRVVPLPAARPSEGRDAVVDALRARKDLPVGEMPREGWDGMLARLAPDQHMALKNAGVFEGDGPVYLSQLIRDFIANTEAPSYQQAVTPAADTKFQARAKELLANTPVSRRSAAGFFNGSLTIPFLRVNADIARYFTVRNKPGMEDPSTPEAKKKLVDALYSDALQALAMSGDAVGWYDRKVKAALDLMAQIHPEIATNDEYKFGFITILAITSNSTKVDGNFEHAELLYRQWKETGDWPVSIIGRHKSGAAMSKSLEQIQELIATHSWEGLRDFMVSDQTIPAIKDFTGSPIAGEIATAKVNGATFLGSKVGAFFNNLYGNFTPVTMDRWFMRTINRNRGNMLAVPANFNEVLGELKLSTTGVFDSYGFDPAVMAAEIDKFNALDEEERSDITVAAETLPTVAAYAKARLNVYQKGIIDSEGVKHSFQPRTKENIIAKVITEGLALDEQTPDGGKDRAELREIMLKLQQKLQKNGIPIVMADLQAVLWYYEKDLFDLLKAKNKQRKLTDVTKPIKPRQEDYEAAARRVVARYERDRDGAVGPGLGGLPSGADSQRSGVAAGAGPAAGVLNQPSAGGLDATLADFTKAGIANILEKDNWVILTAENPAAVTGTAEANAAANEKLVADLTARGLQFTPARGVYGGPDENSFVVVGVTEDIARQLAVQYNQDSVLTRKGLVYQDGSVTPATGVTVFETPPEDFFTVVNDTIFRIELDFEAERIPAPELNQGPRGTFSPTQLLLTLNENADFSTFLHESGHFFLEVLADIASQPGAPVELAQDMGEILSWFGIKDDKKTGQTAIAKWNAMTLDEKRPHHERWAESFEQYLFEGKAPSPELRAVFQRFRSWLTQVYKSLSQFLRTRAGTPGGQVLEQGDESGNPLGLSRDIRQVMDRMLATDDQIAEAERLANFEAVFKSAEEAGMTLTEWKAYQELNAKASNDAIDELQTRSLRDMQWASNAKGKALKALQREAAAKRKEVEAEVTAEVEASAVEQARDYIRSKRVSSPADRDALKDWRGRREAFLERAQADAKAALLASPEAEGVTGLKKGQLLTRNKKLLANEAERQTLLWERENPRPTVALPELELATVAERFGYTSVDHLLKDLAEQPPAAEIIEGVTDQRMLERYGDLIDARAIDAAANEAVHNEARQRFVATELAAMSAAMGVTAETGRTDRTGKPIRVNTIMRAAKGFAEQLVSRRKIGELKPSFHTAAERRAAKRALQAQAKGDQQGAAAAKRDQLLNSYAAKYTGDAKAEVDKAVDYLRKFEKDTVRQNLAPEYTDQIDKLLERFDLRRSTSLRDIDKRASLVKWIEAQRALGVDPVIDEDLVNEAYSTSYKELTVEQFRGLVDAVKNIEHLGRLKSKLLKARDKREFDAIATEIADGIRENGGKERKVNLEGESRVVKWFRGAWAAHRKLNSLVRQMDGGKDNGAFYKAFIASMNEAGAQEDQMVGQATLALADLYKPLLALPGGLTGSKSQVFIPEIKASLTRAGRLSVALNWGNPQNRQRLLSGDKWTEEQALAVIRTLGREELAFVNKTWEYLDSFWPEIKAKQLRVTGVAEDKVEAVPFELTLADGTTVQMRGGYYPIKYDPDRSLRAERQDAEQAAKEILQGARARPTTRRGHTKPRADEVQDRPLVKSLNVITQHVTQVTHDLSWHEWFLDANKLLGDPRIASAIRDHFGPETLRAMTDSVNAIAVGDVATQTHIDQLALKLRANISRSVMGASLTTALLQPFGLTQSMARIGVVPVLKGAARWAGDASRMESSMTWITEKSPFMTNRAKTFNRELREISQRVNGKSKTLQVLDASLFYTMQKLQMVADVPTWIGAYEKALNEGADEQSAVGLADEAVLGSQGGGTTKDLAGVQRTQPFLTQFYSYFNTTLNLMVEKTGATDFKNPKAVMGWLSDMALLAVVPAILPALITYLLKGGGEDDEPEDWAKKVLEWQAGYLFGLLVGVREIPTVWSPFDYSGPPAGRIFNDAKKLVQQAEQGEVDEPLMLAMINVMGSALGLPTVQVTRSYKGWKAWEEGDAPATSILFGPPPKN